MDKLAAVENLASELEQLSVEDKDDEATAAAVVASLVRGDDAANKLQSESFVMGLADMAGEVLR